MNDDELRRHRSVERRVWYAGLGLSAIGTIGALVGAYLAYCAFTQSRRQAEAAFDQNRPWLQVERLDIDRIIRSESELNFEIIAAVKNYGHSPASGVGLYSRVKFAGETRTDKFNYAALLCGDLTSYVGEKHTEGAVVFPDRGVPLADLDRRRSVSEMRQIYSDLTAHDTEPRSFDEFMRSVSLEVVGCLVYDEWGRHVHATSFDFVFPPIDLSKVSVITKDLEGTPNRLAIGYAN